MIQTVCIGGPRHGLAIMVDPEREHVPIPERESRAVTPMPLPGEPTPRLVVHLYSRFEIAVGEDRKFVYVHPGWITTRPKPSLPPVIDALIHLAMHPQIPERIS